jgi:hypothetical protein
MRKHFYIHKGCGGIITGFNIWFGTCGECKKRVQYKQCIHEMREMKEE